MREVCGWLTSARVGGDSLRNCYIFSLKRPVRLSTRTIVYERIDCFYWILAALWFQRCLVVSCVFWIKAALFDLIIMWGYWSKSWFWWIGSNLSLVHLYSGLFDFLWLQPTYVPWFYYLLIFWWICYVTSMLLSHAISFRGIIVLKSGTKSKKNGSLAPPVAKFNCGAVVFHSDSCCRNFTAVS